METFEVNESVVVKHDDGSTASGKVIRDLGDDTYLCFYIGKGGWKSGKFHSSHLTSFGTAMFLCSESYGACLTELAEAAN